MVHKSVTRSRVLKAAKASMFGTANSGFCLACGKTAKGVEPDARKYECKHCHAHRVYGAEELVMMLG